MRKNTHIVGAIFFGVLGFLILESIRHWALPYIGWSLYPLSTNGYISLMLMIPSSFIGGVLPDIIDPPFTKKHRRFAHSKALLFILLILWIISLTAILNENSLGVLSVYYFLLGYISHLSLDSLTPSGLW